MQHRKLTLLAATVAALAAPPVVLAADDGDVLPGDPPALTTVYGADGSVTEGTAPVGERAFVDRLVAAGAAAGVLRNDTRGYAHPTESRVGYAAPTTRLARLQGRVPGARGRVTVAWTTQADGRRTMERGYAVEIATGAIRRVPLADARRFSEDPRAGKPGLGYVYSAERNLPAGAPFGG